MNLFFFPVIGFLAVIWFLFRTIPKPSRVVYPCQKVAAGIGVSFLTYLGGLAGSFVLFKKFKQWFKNPSRNSVVVISLSLCLLAGVFTSLAIDAFIFDPEPVYADWNPIDAPNTPIGTARGIYPGRVTWSHNPNATAEMVSGNWWQPGNTDQQVVNEMMSGSLKGLAGTGSTSAAWDAIFHYFNQNNDRGDRGFEIGESLVIKINTVNTYRQSKSGNAIDACAEVVNSLIGELVTQAGVPENNIIIYDGGVGAIGSYIVSLVTGNFPGVRFEANQTSTGVQKIQWVDNGITYSSGGTTPGETRRVAKCLWDADYLINLALLKKHEDQTAVTLTGKNHFGSIENCRLIHSSINDQDQGMDDYNCLVDLMGHERIGGKTLLYIINGLWGSEYILGSPVKWMTAPFNNDWPSSIFMSIDGIAIDSVGLDFINKEFTLWANADNYLHEGARADNATSGVFYDPENDGTGLPSQGVHEHWNNATDRQYTRNLGTGDGIELYVVGQSTGGGETGDVDENGIIDIVDALKTAQYYVGLNPPDFSRAYADVDSDGTITIVDALMVAQYYVGLITEF